CVLLVYQNLRSKLSMKPKIYFFLFLILAFVSGFIYLYFFPKNSPLITPSLNFPSSPLKPSPTPTSTPTVTFGLVGDLGLGRFITATARSKNDFSWSFSGVSHLLQSTDFNLANLESPIITNCPEGKTGTFTFCGDTRFLPYLKQNKFIFNLANNHIYNYGQDGFSQTQTLLSQSQIGFFHSQVPATEFYQTTINSISFGFLGFDLITYPHFNHQKIIDLVSQYQSQVDWLIVSLHWGNEYLPQAETWRHTLAHQLVDAGADIIHGHHPHVLQETEVYHSKPIFYSLGNFIFDQNWSQETSLSQLTLLSVTKDQIISTQDIPLIIKSNSRPELIKQIK
ncbi:MAG TPA: CapA family protein, partial [Candidatus Woesebacteria bacterium]|nr:CapA family protein [Candidatus Woesebacteria bacterium]